MPIKPFEKGNPGGPGRPKGGQIDWCREFAEGEGREKLIALARSKSPKVSLQALKLIFAYGHGKPAQSLDLTSNGQSIDFLSALDAARQRIIGTDRLKESGSGAGGGHGAVHP